MISKSLRRFIKYSAIGALTFAFDLGLLYVLVSILSVNYIFATGLGFTLAISTNYVLSRKYVFKGTARSFKAGYMHFVVIAAVGLLAVTSAMYVLVGVLGFNYLLSRIGIAAVVGAWNYTMNLFVNFKVAGKH